MSFGNILKYLQLMTSHMQSVDFVVISSWLKQYDLDSMSNGITLSNSSEKKCKLTKIVADLEESFHGPSGSQTSTATVVVPATNDDLENGRKLYFCPYNI